MNSFDISSILVPVVQGTAIVATPLLIALLWRLAQKVATYFGVQTTEAQRTAFAQAAQRTADKYMPLLIAGTMKLSEVHVANPTIAADAQMLVNVLGPAAASLGYTPATAAGLIVGAIGNALAKDPATPIVPAASLPPVPMSTLLPAAVAQAIVAAAVTPAAAINAAVDALAAPK